MRIVAEGEEMAEEDAGQEESRGFKVSDRRFSVRGYEEEEEEASEKKEAPQETAPPREAPPAEGVEAGAGKAEGKVSREFDTFLAILQGNALAAMGLHPQTGQRVGQADPRSARLFVDTIGMMKEKMQGNLTPDEERLIGQVLSDLQMIYVQQVGFD